jgi:hypothetical protein
LRRRNGLLALIACVAIVATASQLGTQQGPVSLLQSEVGEHQAKVPVDTQNGLTEEGHGLSAVRNISAQNGNVLTFYIPVHCMLS